MLFNFQRLHKSSQVLNMFNRSFQKIGHHIALSCVFFQVEDISISANIMGSRSHLTRINSLRRFRTMITHRKQSDESQGPPEVAIADGEGNITNNNHSSGQKGEKRTQR